MALNNHDVTLHVTGPKRVGLTVEDSRTNYNALQNKPQIEGVTLQGNRTLQDFGITKITNQSIDEICRF